MVNKLQGQPHKQHKNSLKLQTAYPLVLNDYIMVNIIGLLDNINVRFVNMVYRRIVGIPMGTNCTSLIADLFLYCYESQKEPSKHDFVNKFNNSFGHLDEVLALNN